MPSLSPRRALAGAVLATAMLGAGAAPASAEVSATIFRDSLRIASDADSDRIDVSSNFIDPDGVVVRTPDEFIGNFDREDFDNILVVGGAGNDTITISGSEIYAPTDPVTINGDAGDDTISGGAGRETILGGADADRIDGGAGDDLVSGAAGDDTLAGGAGDDNVTAGAGVDSIAWEAGHGSDDVDGGADSDSLALTGKGSADAFLVEVVAGSPRVVHDVTSATIDLAGLERLAVEGRSGDDVVSTGSDLPDSLDLDVLGQNGADVITGGPGDDELDGGPGADSLRGGGGADIVQGGIDADVVHGDAGDDLLSGGDGDDTLSGDEGADFLRGGAGGDRFGCDGRDTVFDLSPADAPTGACLAPAPDPGGGQAPGPQPQPGAPAAPGAGAPQAGGDSLPRGFLGFAKPRVTRVAAGLKITVRNTHSAPISVLIAASERRGRVGGRYKAVRKTIAAGRRATVTLKAPRALRRARGKRRATVTVTNRATGGKLVARR